MKYPAAELRGIQFSKKLSSPLRNCVVINKKLCLVRDFARKKWPLRGNLQIPLINLPLWQRGIEGDFPDLKSPLAPLFQRGGNGIKDISTNFCRCRFTKRLRLVRDFARKRWPQWGNVFFVGSASSPTGPAGGVACPTYSLKPQKIDKFLSIWVH